MKSKRKSAKAKPVALLTKIEALLCDALDELSSMGKSVEKNVRELLLSAEASVVKAKDFITPVPASEVPRTPARRRKRAGRRLRPARSAR